MKMYPSSSDSSRVGSTSSLSSKEESRTNMRNLDKELEDLDFREETHSLSTASTDNYEDDAIPESIQVPNDSSAAYTELGLLPSDIVHGAKGVGRFFTHVNKNEFVLWVVKDCRIKAGTFKNGTAPAFVENRNLHDLPQNGRSAWLMYNQLPVQPGKATQLDPPGTLFTLGIIWNIDYKAGKIHLFSLKPQAAGVEVLPPSEYGFENCICPWFGPDPLATFLRTEFEPVIIDMGRHSIFFINQIEGDTFLGDADYYRDDIINIDDRCYQCDPDGPDFFGQDDDDYGDDIFPPSTSHSLIHRIDCIPWLDELAVDQARKRSNIKAFKKYATFYRPYTFTVSDMAMQHVYMVPKTENMKARIDLIHKCLPVHHPSTYNSPLVLVSYLYKSDVQKLFKVGQVHIIQFEDTLRKLSVFDDYYVNLRSGYPSAQVRAVSEAEWKNVERMYEHSSSSSYSATSYELENSPKPIYQFDGKFDSYDLPGHMLTRWTRDGAQQQWRMSHDVVDVFRKANKNGFGDRTISTSVGVASYYGKRGSSQSTKTPVEGPGYADRSQYYRVDNNRHPEYMVVANKILKRMATVSGSIRKKLDPVMTMIHTTNTVENFNRMKSTTFGSPQRSLSFGCAPHADKTDCGTKCKQRQFMSEFKKKSEASVGGFQYAKRLKYASSFFEEYGIGKSTCVMYQMIRNPSAERSRKQSGHLQQLFINLGLFTASRITDLSSFIFYAFAFLHCSSVGVEVFDDNYVRLGNVNDDHIFSFSNSA